MDQPERGRAATTTQRALVRRPGPRLADGIVTHVSPTSVDLALAVQQWHRYIEVLHEHGWDTIEVPAADDCPDAVFVEDTVVVYRNLAVITRPGADARRAETDATEQVVASLGYAVTRILPPGTLDGGDVLKIGDPDRGGVVYVARSGRTNAEGIRQLRTILSPLGATVVAVPTTRVLHLKSAVTALPDGTVIGFEPLVDVPSLFPRFLPVPEETGAHVVLLGGDRLLMAADAPATADLLADLGWQPVLVDISEFAKLDGCVTCLSVRLRHLGT